MFDHVGFALPAGSISKRATAVVLAGAGAGLGFYKGWSVLPLALLGGGAVLFAVSSPGEPLIGPNIGKKNIQAGAQGAANAAVGQADMQGNTTDRKLYLAAQKDVAYVPYLVGALLIGTAGLIAYRAAT